MSLERSNYGISDFKPSLRKAYNLVHASIGGHYSRPSYVACAAPSLVGQERKVLKTISCVNCCTVRKEILDGKKGSMQIDGAKRLDRMLPLAILIQCLR